MYVTYNNFEFKVEKNLKITYVGSQNTSGNGSGTGSGNGSGSGGSPSTGGGSGSNTLYGCRAYAKVEVTDAIMGQMTLNANVTDNPKVKLIEYYVDGKLVHTGLERSYTVTGLQSEVEYNVSAIVEYEPDEILTIAKVQDIGIVSVNSTHTASEKTIGWEMLERFAKIISDNEGTGEKQVNLDSAGITFAVGKETYTIGIGDTFTLDGKKVRLLGFNHDELVDKTVYGGNNTHAGISFEYVDFITSNYKKMNTTDTNSGGWGACELRKLLNGTDETIADSEYEKLKNIIEIKKVKKQYLETYNDTSSLKKSEDYLWLLSFSEIFGWITNGYGGSTTNVEEGEQYKCFKDMELKCSGTSSNTQLKKYYKTNYEGYWWLRSMPCSYSEKFLMIDDKGMNNANWASADYYVAPGFAI